MKCNKWALVLVGVLAASMAVARTEPNSFFNVTVSSKAEMMRHIKSDNQVMVRFMRHFGMTRDEVITYFDSLHMEELKEDGVYLVYNVPESEEIRARAIFYKKGTKVWVDPNGTIVLKASCGNPMLRGTDKTTVAIESPIETAIAPVMPTEAVIPQGVPVPTVPQVLPDGIESSALPFAAESPADLTSIITSGSSFNPAFLLPLAAVPFIIKDGDNPPDAIPEPATFVALASGAGLIAARRKKKAKA